MTRRVDPDFSFGEPDKQGYDWRKWLGIAVVALLVAVGAFVLYKNIAAG